MDTRGEKKMAVPFGLGQRVEIQIFNVALGSDEATDAEVFVL